MTTKPQVQITLTELCGAEDIIPSPNHKAPMLATIGIMTGLDLMSKLSTNELSGGRTGFKKFVETYGGLSSIDAETIYRLRCAQTHAYCLIDLDERAKTEYCFMLVDEKPDEPLIHAHVAREAHGYRQETFQINFWALKRFFLACVQKFESAMRNPNGTHPGLLLTQFMLAMARVGKVEVS